MITEDFSTRSHPDPNTHIELGDSIAKTMFPKFIGMNDLDKKNTGVKEIKSKK